MKLKTFSLLALGFYVIPTVVSSPTMPSSK